tara:strand:- start:1681 stop:1929 length:249 start_codon:yes stop_codon:yes gene_type:complete
MSFATLAKDFANEPPIQPVLTASLKQTPLSHQEQQASFKKILTETPKDKVRGICGKCNKPVTIDHYRVKENDIYYHLKCCID